MRAGIEPSHDDIVTAHKMHKHGLAVPNWPVQRGGEDWTPVQYHIWRDELDLACVPRWHGPDGAAMSACAAMSLSGAEPTANSKENE